MFVYVGANPVTDFIDVKDILDERGQIITNENMETKSQGLFAAGDDRQTRLRQVATAVSDGAKAAYSVKEYLKNKLWKKNFSRRVKDELTLLINDQKALRPLLSGVVRVSGVLILGHEKS